MNEELQREINNGLTDLELAAALMRELLDIDKWNEVIGDEWRYFNETI